MKQNLSSILTHYDISQPQRVVRKEKYHAVKPTDAFKVDNRLYFTYIMKKSKINCKIVDKLLMLMKKRRMDSHLFFKLAFSI